MTRGPHPAVPHAREGGVGKRLGHMIKDLVVNLSVGTDRDPAAHFAISIAARFQAHIAGVAFAYDPIITPTVLNGLSASWVDAQRAENRAAAQEAVDRFD